MGEGRARTGVRGLERRSLETMLPACSRVGFVRPSGETGRNDKRRKGVWGSGLSWGFGEVMAHAPELLVLQGSGVRAAQLPHIWKGRCEWYVPSSASPSS